MRPRLFLLCAFLSLASMCVADVVPAFHSSAQVRARGERAERAKNFEDASAAFAQEAKLRAAQGDLQGAEVQRRRAARLHTELTLVVRTDARPTYKLARLEPERGCLLGVLDQSGREADVFEERAGRNVAVAFDYETYGRPFPIRWARREADVGRAVQIAWEPNAIDTVQDDAYLNRWADDAARCGTHVFVRFGGEMNGAWTLWGRDPRRYRRAFRTVAEVLHRATPNAALIWAPNATPTDKLDQFWPGDDAVDWVGISLYLVRFYDDSLTRPAYNDHPATFIAPFYAKYAAHHPICLVECGISRRSRVENKDADDFAAIRIFDLLDAVKVRFPRLKMVCWFDRNNLSRARPGRRLNDYSLPEGSQALEAFRAATNEPYFLGRFDDVSPYAYRRVTSILPDAPLAASLSTYHYEATLEGFRDGASVTLSRPFVFSPPPGRGPVLLRVHDRNNRIAGTWRYNTP